MLRCSHVFILLALVNNAILSKRMKFSVAPMMAHTTPHFRYFWSLISKYSTLFSEMMVDEAYIGAKFDNSLKYEEVKVHSIPNPSVIQLGGNNPTLLAQATKLLSDVGLYHINLNCGCPSTTVATQHRMGAYLMLEPTVTANCCLAMMKAQPQQLGSVSVKCRIGVDDIDNYDSVYDFISHVSKAGNVNNFQVHARKAVLSANTIANRDIPPLNYNFVYRLARDFPELNIEINGGIASLDDALQHYDACPQLSGVMLGRACINHPYQFIHTDRIIYGDNDSIPLSRGEILEQYIDYCKKYEAGIKTRGQQRGGWSSHTSLIAPAFNLFAGEEGGEIFRRRIKAMSAKIPVASLILQAAARELPLHSLDNKQFLPITELAVYDLARKTSGPIKRMIQ